MAILSHTKSTAVKCGATAIAALTLGCGYHSDGTPFDVELWEGAETAAMTDADAPRLRMADTLVDDRLLVGKARPQVESMLGPPTRTSKFSDDDIVYWLGPERGFMSIDSEWLVINFNDEDAVEVAKIVRD